MSYIDTFDIEFVGYFSRGAFYPSENGIVVKIGRSPGG